MTPSLPRPIHALSLALIGISAVLPLLAQNPAIFVNMATTQVTSGSTPTSAATTTIAAPGTGWAYSAAAPVAGTSWNNILRPNPLIASGTADTKGQFVCNSANNIALNSATGVATGVTLTVSIDVQELNGTRTEPNTGTGGNTVLGPSALMNSAWRIYLGGNSVIHRLTGLPVGAHYYLYAYGSTTTANQGCKFTLDAANVPGGGDTFVETYGSSTGNIFTTDGSTYSLTAPASANVASSAANPTTWGRIHAVVDGSGILTFRTGKNSANGQYFNGYQLMPFPKPVISAQPMANVSATVGSDLTLAVTASGEGTLNYQWRKNASPLSDGASGGGSTYAGTTTGSLVISGVTADDVGNYDVVVTNDGGPTTSTASAVSVTTSALAPSIVTSPAATTAVAGGTASFSVTANGSAPLSFQWQKSLDNLNFTNIATSATLNLSTVTVADAGYYRVVVTNSAGSTTSASASLTVAPVIVTPPVALIVPPGNAHTLAVVADAGAGSPQAITYVWRRDGVTVANGSGITGATTANLAVTSFSAAVSGYYTVTISNSAGSVTTAPVYVGVASAQSVSSAPLNNTTGIAIDQQLRLTFPSAPKIGKSGKILIRDAADDSITATIDVSQFVTFSLFSATIPNAAVRTVQGSSYFYTPVAIYGNEVWITLSPTQRFAYGKTYYVNIEPGVLLDSTNAAFPGYTGSAAWRFSTKVAGPATPTASTGPTTLTVGQDGTGDFATLQGAADWVPQNNTLRRHIRIKPGVYRDNATFAQNRNFVSILGDGASRDDVLIHSPYAAFSTANDRSSGSLRVESSDVTVCDLTIDNGVYLPNPANGAPAWAGPLNTVYTSGNRLVFDNVLMKGGQDTLYANSGSGYYHRCEIWGSTDFIYGGALAVFDDCDIVEIKDTGGPITAPSTGLAQPYGEVFINSRFPRAQTANGYPYNVGTANTTFMRPWRQDGMTAIINCALGTQITTKGWNEWSAAEGEKAVTCRARENGTTLIGGGAASSVAQRQTAGAYWLNTIDPDYTGLPMEPSNALVAPGTGTGNRMPVTVNPADYTVAAIFGHAYFNLNGWLPALRPRITTQPSAVTTNPGQNVSFSVVVNAAASVTYQWYRNNVLIPGATSATHSITGVRGAHVGNYTVVVANSVESLTSTGAQLFFNDPLQTYVSIHGLDPLTNGAPVEDPDGDGTCNKLEFFLGGNPAMSQPGIIPSCHLTQSPDAIVFEFDRNTSAAAVAYLVEHTSDLGGPWLPVVNGQNGVTITVSSVNFQKEHVTVTIPQTALKDFARLRLP